MEFNYTFFRYHLSTPSSEESLMLVWDAASGFQCHRTFFCNWKDFNCFNFDVSVS